MAKRQILNSKNKTLLVTHLPEEPDWSDLPPELISLISRKLIDIFDFVRLRAVCKTWRSAVRTSDLTPQLPWIMDNSDQSFKKGYLRFYSLLTGKTHNFNVPRSIQKFITGSAYNYLFSYDMQTCDCSLINPLTKDEISLPPSPVGIWYPTCVPADPSSRYAVISIHPTLKTTDLLFCQLGDLDWTLMKEESFPYYRIHGMGIKCLLEGFVFHDGLCYATDRDTGSTVVINLATQTVICVAPQPESELRKEFAYLIVSAGEILRVCQYNKRCQQETSYFDIYRLHLGNRDGNVINPCWIKIDNINHQFLFLHGKHGCSFRADDFSGFIGNSIYFLTKRNIKETYILSRYNLKDGKIGTLQVPEELGCSWFVPSLCKKSSNYR
ncbi:F-box family protein [Rhynchospora pubera]|uniref:F-box family protein n=1 Tax=Rhynchospora pubera TaxID=906938 RepID=A0AAV8GNQ8_9POAL|nr:F-box family protein [Rhynchospora pubera]